MRRSTVLALACLAAAFAPAAAAHVTVVPPFAAAGGEARLVLDVPNERRSQPMIELDVRLPAGMEARGGEPLGSWRASVAGRTVTWRGGSLPPRATARFALDVTAPPRAGAVQLVVAQRYPDGGRVPWRVALTVTPADTGGGQHLGAAAIAAAAGLVAIVGGLLVLQRQRARSLQER